MSESVDIGSIIDECLAREKFVNIKKGKEDNTTFTIWGPRVDPLWQCEVYIVKTPPLKSIILHSRCTTRASPSIYNRLNKLFQRINYSGENRIPTFSLDFKGGEVKLRSYLPFLLTPSSIPLSNITLNFTKLLQNHFSHFQTYASEIASMLLKPNPNISPKVSSVELSLHNNSGQNPFESVLSCLRKNRYELKSKQSNSNNQCVYSVNPALLIDWETSMITKSDVHTTVSLYSVYSKKIPIDCLAEFSDGLFQINEKLRVENFELDFGTGQLRLRSTLLLSSHYKAQLVISQVAPTFEDMMKRHVQTLLRNFSKILEIMPKPKFPKSSGSGVRSDELKISDEKNISQKNVNTTYQVRADLLKKPPLVKEEIIRVVKEQISLLGFAADPVAAPTGTGRDSIRIKQTNFDYQWKIFVSILPGRSYSIIILRSRCRFEALPHMFEEINAINQEIPFGNFEYESEKKEVCFKSALPTSDNCNNTFADLATMFYSTLTSHFETLGKYNSRIIEKTNLKYREGVLKSEVSRATNHNRLRSGSSDSTPINPPNPQNSTPIIDFKDSIASHSPQTSSSAQNKRTDPQNFKNFPSSNSPLEPFGVEEGKLKTPTQSFPPSLSNSNQINFEIIPKIQSISLNHNSVTSQTTYSPQPILNSPQNSLQPQINVLNTPLSNPINLPPPTPTPIAPNSPQLNAIHSKNSQQQNPPNLQTPNPLPALKLSDEVVIQTAVRNIKMEDIRYEMDAKGEKVIIGKGGFAIVYKGRMGADHVVVKKMIMENLEEAEEIQHALLEEVEILARLSHRYIVNLFGIVKDPPCIVMQYFAKGSLASVLKKERGILTWKQKNKILLGAARGLAYIHRNNIIHGDLKPENILVDENNEACITDFGLAKTRKATVSYTEVRGMTPFYSAPEVIEKDLIYSKSDIYSFGIIIWQISTETVPYSDNPLVIGPNKWNLMMNIVNGLRPNVGALPQGIPLSYYVLMSKCWDRDMETRPSSDQLVNALEDVNSSLRE